MRQLSHLLFVLPLLGACAEPEITNAIQSLPSRGEVTAPFLYGKAVWRAREYRVAPGERIRIGSHVWINDDCSLEERAEVVAFDPPKHGHLDVDTALTKVTELKPGPNWEHCGGRRIPVSHVWYTAPRDFTGRESFAYERVRPSTNRRDLVVVDVIVE